MPVIFMGGSFTPVTSYANTGGTGNRTAIITVSSNFSLQGGTFDNLVDGDTVNQDNATGGCDMPTTGPANGDYIRFTWATKVYIDELTWKKSTSTSEGSFFIKGGDTVGGLTTLATVPTLGDATADIIPFTSFPPPEGYLIYQIEKNGAGAWDGVAWTREVEFKIAPGA